MVYILAPFMLICGYYTITYGISVLKEDKNVLGGVAIIAIAVIGIVFPAILVFWKRALG